MHPHSLVLHRFREFSQDVPAEGRGVHDVERGLRRLEHREAVVVAGGQRDVAGAGLLEGPGPLGGVEAGGIESRRRLAVGLRIQVAGGKIPFTLGVGAVDAPVQEDAQPVLGELFPGLQVPLGRDIRSLGASAARKERQRRSQGNESEMVMHRSMIR